MIGQKYISRYVTDLLRGGFFPHFAIFVGPKGCGKKTFLKENFSEAVYLEDNKVDSVRRMIEMAYKMRDKVFIMPDADDMSNAAKNALLKVVEECPNNNYFIMTLEDEVNTLVTIRSRAQIFYMDRYYPQDLSDYASSRLGVDPESEEMEILTDVCETPGEAEMLVNFGITELYDYVKLVFENVAEVNIANALKIPAKVSLKAGSEGYDLRLFWKIFQMVCIENENSEWSIITSKYLIALKTKGINKQMLMDTWIFDLRWL